MVFEQNYNEKMVGDMGFLINLQTQQRNEHT